MEGRGASSGADRSSRGTSLSRGGSSRPAQLNGGKYDGHWAVDHEMPGLENAIRPRESALARVLDDIKWKVPEMDGALFGDINLLDTEAKEEEDGSFQETGLYAKSRLSQDERMGQDLSKLRLRKKKFKVVISTISWLNFLFWSAWAAFYIVFMVFLVLPNDLDADDWGYSDEKIAPPVWHTLSDEYYLCGLAGQSQSPINILVDRSAPGANVVRSPQSNFLPTLASFLDVRTGTFVVESVPKRGPTYECADRIDLVGRDNFLSCGRLLWRTIEYHLQEIRAHIPSEHTFNGVAGAFELQYIFRSTRGDQAGLATIYAAASKVNDTALNPLWWSLLNASSLVSRDDRMAEGVQLNALVALDNGYYQYSGSSTIPPCSENFEWFISATLQNASEDQVNAFRRSNVGIIGNSRPVQPLNDRLVSLYT